MLKIIVAFTQLGATRRRQLWIRDKIVHCAWVARRIRTWAHACSLLTRTLGRAARAGGTVRYGSTDESSN